LKIAKPAITPIVMNRDTSSAFLEEIKAAKVTPIEPVFLDYSKDMGQFKAKSDIPVLYKQNVTNDLFDILYVYEMGNNNDKLLGTAFQYLKYLGTSKMTLNRFNPNSINWLVHSMYSAAAKEFMWR
jgi:hypothetical protein